MSMLPGPDQNEISRREGARRKLEDGAGWLLKPRPGDVTADGWMRAACPCGMTGTIPMTGTCPECGEPLPAWQMEKANAQREAV